MPRSSTIGFEEIPPLVASTENPTVKPQRRARLPRFMGQACDPDLVLGDLKVGVVGTGSVGARVAEHIARFQIAELWLIDNGCYKPESLLTQPIGPGDLLQPKVGVVGRRCRAISPGTSVYVCENSVESLPPTVFADLSVVLVATDNLQAELDVGRKCAAVGVPLLFAAVHGESLTAQVRFYGNAGDVQSPCPTCSLTAQEWNQLNEQTRFACDGFFAPIPHAQVHAQPTRSPAALCSLAADLAVMQILRFALVLGKDVLDTSLEYCAYRHTSVTSALQRNPNCRAEHLTWIRTTPRQALAECSLSQLAREAADLKGQQARESGHRSSTNVSMAGCLPGTAFPRVAFGVDELAFAEKGMCSCGNIASILKFVSDEATEKHCMHCLEPFRVLPYFTHRRVPASALGELLHQPLKDLCPIPPGWIVVHEGERATLFVSRMSRPQAEPGRWNDEDRSRHDAA